MTDKIPTFVKALLGIGFLTVIAGVMAADWPFWVRLVCAGFTFMVAGCITLAMGHALNLQKEASHEL